MDVSVRRQLTEHHTSSRNVCTLCSWREPKYKNVSPSAGAACDGSASISAAAFAVARSTVRSWTIARIAARPVPGPMSSMLWSRLGGSKSPVLSHSGTRCAFVALAAEVSGVSVWKYAEQTPVRRRLYGVRKSTSATVKWT